MTPAPITAEIVETREVERPDMNVHVSLEGGRWGSFSGKPTMVGDIGFTLPGTATVASQRKIAEAMEALEKVCRGSYGLSTMHGDIRNALAALDAARSETK